MRELNEKTLGKDYDWWLVWIIDWFDNFQEMYEIEVSDTIIIKFVNQHNIEDVESGRTTYYDFVRFVKELHFVN